MIESLNRNVHLVNIGSDFHLDMVLVHSYTPHLFRYHNFFYLFIKLKVEEFIKYE